MNKKVYIFRMTRDTKVFKKGQKVFAQFMTGSLAAMVRGRYKGKGRWLSAWVHWPDPEDGKGFFCKPDCRVIGMATLSEDFRRYIGLEY